MRTDRRYVLGSLASAAAAGLACRSGVARAQQAYPTRPVKVLIPVPAGGTFDGIPRIVLQDIADAHGWPSVLENRPGADGQVALTAARQNPADGYTLASINSITHGSAPALKLTLGYDAYKDFAPISKLAEGAMVLLVKKDLPVRSLPELIALLKQRPGQLNYGTGGPSSQHFFATAMLFQRAGLPLDIAAHVPFAGIAPALFALLAGSVDFMIGSPGPAIENINTGAIRALAATSLTRMTRLPDVPTIAELGYPGFELVTWVGLAALAGTPRPIVDQWNAHANAALKRPAVRERIAGMDFEPRGSTVAEFEAFSAAEIDKYRKLVDDLKLQRR